MDLEKDTQNLSSSNDRSLVSKEEESHEPPQPVVSNNQINEIPNGGLKAWLQVLGSFFLFFNSWFVCPLPERR
jgi:hypothetical protein